MSTRKIVIFALVFSAIVIYSCCDVIDPPYRQTNSNTGTDTTENVRKILLEVYTGFTCGNCPEAADHAHEFADVYKGRIIILAVHAGYYAKPKGTHTYDFRTPAGNELDAFFGNGDAGNPNGMVSRLHFPEKNHILRYTQWELAIKEIIDEKAKMSIKLTTSYDNISHTITVSAVVRYLQNSGVNDQLAVYIVEDSVVQYQQDDRQPNPNVDNYVHDNVLRGAITSTWGDKLSDSPIMAGDSVIKQYTYQIPTEKDWRTEKLRILAYVHDHNASYEVYQCEDKKLLP